MRQTFNIKAVMHLSKEYQQNAADILIAKLRQELAAANEYIAELEEGLSPKIKEQEQLISYLKKENTAMQKKFSAGVGELDKEARVAKLLEDRRALQEENKKLINTRDHLLYLLNKKSEQ